MSNLLEDLNIAREEADVMVQKLDRVQGRLVPVRGEDSSGEVVVRVDADGQLVSVQVGFGWRERLTHTELPAAVLEALGNAKMARFELWANAYKDSEDEPAPRARPTNDGIDLVQAFKDRVVSQGSSPRVAAEMVESVLSDVVEGLEEANRLLDAHEGRQFMGRSGRGVVTAQVAGNGDLQSIEFDAGWLGSAHSANLGREATQAIRAATEKARQEGLAAVIKTTRLAQIARMVTDPDTAHNFWK